MDSIVLIIAVFTGIVAGIVIGGVLTRAKSKGEVIALNAAIEVERATIARLEARAQFAH